MRLLNFEGYTVTVAPEAMALKPFREIWNRDRTQSKDRALSELGFIYFFVDPRSSYMYIVDEDERMQTIKEHQGLPDKWKPDDKLLKAIDTYKDLVLTTSSLMVEDLRAVIERLRLWLKNLDIESVLADDDNKKVNLASLVKAITDMPSLLTKFMEVEEKANKEVVEKGKLRANKAKAVTEDGLSNFFNKK